MSDDERRESMMESNLVLARFVPLARSRSPNIELFEVGFLRNRGLERKYCQTKGAHMK